MGADVMTRRLFTDSGTGLECGVKRWSEGVRLYLPLKEEAFIKMSLLTYEKALIMTYSSYKSDQLINQKLINVGFSRQVSCSFTTVNMSVMSSICKTLKVK